MLSENLKRIREEQRYTRVLLAKKIGINAATIQNIENGTNDNPKIKTIIALANALNVSVSKLIK